MSLSRLVTGPRRCSCSLVLQSGHTQQPRSFVQPYAALCSGALNFLSFLQTGQRFLSPCVPRFAVAPRISISLH